MKTVYALLTFSIAVLLMASCAKEEPTPPANNSSNNNQSSNSNNNVSGGNNNGNNASGNPAKPTGSNSLPLPANHPVGAAASCNGCHKGFKTFPEIEVEDWAVGQKTTATNFNLTTQRKRSEKVQ